jgi:DNA-binding NtrC family response regulator
MKGRVLIVDDEKNMGLVIQAMLERDGFEVLFFHESTEALDAIESEELDAVVTDLYMPGHGGMEILEHAKRHQPQVPVVMITAFGTVESAVTALKNGAFDFITKPFDQTDLIAIVNKACLTRRERMSEPALPAEGSATPPLGKISAPDFPLVGKSVKGIELRRAIEKAAPSDSAVLLIGEMGTGKELVAQEIHRLSGRSAHSLITVNCSVIPTELMESELFGYERGAFTGAVSSKPGRFELAHEGTLFLDAVNELSPELQAKLMRALTDGEFERVGGLGTIRVNVRIIASSAVDLNQAVATGKFREDLYYRLNTLPIQLPPLRERQEDIDPLVDRFISRFNESHGRDVKSVEPAARAALRKYSWPGNLRQLENAIERMVLFTDSDVLQLRDLPDEVGSDATSSPSEAMSFKETVRRQTHAMERGLIEKALEETDGNVTRTAEKLGLSRKGLQLKMKELGIKR